MGATFDGVELEVHSHLCVFHHGPTERDDLLIPFLHEGVRRGEACQYFPAAGEEGDAEKRLEALGPRLRVREPDGRRLRGDTLDSDAVLAELDDWSRREGTACRVAGDMGWVGRPLLRREQLDA